MKLPEKYDLYKHNEKIDELFGWAGNLFSNGFLRDEPGEEPATIKEICDDSLRAIKHIKAIVIHLELAIDEVLKKSEIENDK